jgi:Tol biopolymer transport system component
MMRNKTYLLCTLALTLVTGLAPVVTRADDPGLTELEAKHMSNLRQVTFGLPRAGEGYFSPDGQLICYQAYPVGYPFYQIYIQRLDEREGRRISTGHGRTTCSFFSRDGKKLIFASSHSDPNMAETERQGRAEAARGGHRRYQWNFDPYMEIYECNLDGSGLKALTHSTGYDAEGSFSADGKHIVFTSTRNGNPNLYVMDADGSNVRQLTHQSGYNGGPFFSPDDRWVIFRSDRKKKDMLQLYAVSADGQHEVELTTNLDTVNWAPYFHPSGKYIVYTMADYAHGPQQATYDLYTMEIKYDGTHFQGGAVTRVTDKKGTDILPVFSPDGKKLMWTSTRTPNGTSQLWIADWRRGEKESAAAGQ